MHITIVGAGPAGSYTGCLLAKQGHDVHIYEEHETIGSPIQCTGILTEDILNTFPDLAKHESCVNIIKNVRIIAPDNSDALFPVTEYIVCRTKFDQMIAQLAKDAGATFHTNHVLLRVTDSGLVFRNKTTNEEVTVSSSYIIGADGPRSKIAKHFFPKNNIPSYAGFQTVVTKAKENVRMDVYDAYLGEDYPHFFGWDVPESSTKTRLGLAVKEKPTQYYKKFCERVAVQDDMIGQRQGGQIPWFRPRNKWYASHKDVHAFLVGDAATQIKSTTGGGIIPHLKCCQLLADCIARDSFTSYRPKLLSSATAGLYVHLFARKILDTFSDKDYNKLVRWMRKDAVVRILQEVSRDRAEVLIPKLLFAQPKLLYFAKNGPKSLVYIIKSFT